MIPLKVTEEEGALVKRVVDELNKKLKDLQMTYSRKDLQDCLSMTLLSYAVEYYKQKDNRDDESLNKRLADIEKQLDEAIA